MSIVYITSPPPPEPRYAYLAVRVDPDFLGAEARARQAADDRRRPAHVAVRQRHRRLRDAIADRAP